MNARATTTTPPAPDAADQAANQAADQAPATRPFAVVTGGSQGIGFAIADRLAARGAAILLVARTASTLETAAAAIRASHAAEVATLPLDLTDAGALHALDQRLASLGGHVDCLVNNAGIGHTGRFSRIEPELIDRLIALDLGAPLRLMRHVLPGMQLRRRGAIINVASLAGYAPGPYQTVYYASKAALLSASEAIAAEVHRDNIRVTAVVPGPVNTAFHAAMGAERAFYRRFLPGASPHAVARWAVLGNDVGLRVVAPGILSLMGLAACWILPHVILVPILAALLHPRTTGGEGADNDV